MGLTDVAGVFSRYFIVGFFVPAFFVLLLIAVSVDPAWLPSVYENANSGERIAVVGGGALLVGLVLVGLHHQVLRLYEGYPLQRQSRAPRKQLHSALIWFQQRRLDKLRQEIESSPDAERFDMRWRLDQRFPHSDEHLLPTAFGNVVRAFERHSWTRWHLNGIGAWSHIEPLLSDHEAQILADAKGEVAFFINGSLMSAVAATVLAGSAITDEASPPWYVGSALCLGLVALAYLSYRAGVSAASRWGSAVRAMLDMHRLEFYEKLGLRPPRDFTDERTIAWHLNATLLVGDRLPDELAAPVPEDQPESRPPPAAVGVPERVP